MECKKAYYVITGAVVLAVLFLFVALHEVILSRNIHSQAKIPKSFASRDTLFNNKEYSDQSKQLGRLLDKYYVSGWSNSIKQDFNTFVEQLKETLVDFAVRNAPKKLINRTSSQILCLQKIIDKESDSAYLNQDLRMV